MVVNVIKGTIEATSSLFDSHWGRSLLVHSFDHYYFSLSALFFLDINSKGWDFLCEQFLFDIKENNGQRKSHIQKNFVAPYRIMTSVITPVMLLAILQLYPTMPLENSHTWQNKLLILIRSCDLYKHFEMAITITNTW